MHTLLRERLLAGLGTAIIVALLGTALVLGLNVDIATRREQVMALLDVRAPSPPPPRPKPHVEHPKARRAASAPSPPNLRNKAAAIVPPPPLVKLPPPPPPLVTAPKAGTGMAASAGASNRPGPGQGAGGRGDGTGAGGEGDGDGGGGTAPRQIRGRLKYSDLPADLREAGRGAAVSVRYRVEPDGRVSDCGVTRSSGSAELDATTCDLIRQRFRFDPSRDEDGRPTWAFIVENHSWTLDHNDHAPPDH